MTAHHHFAEQHLSVLYLNLPSHKKKLSLNLVTFYARNYGFVTEIKWQKKELINIYTIRAEHVHLYYSVRPQSIKAIWSNIALLTVVNQKNKPHHSQTPQAFTLSRFHFFGRLATSSYPCNLSWLESYLRKICIYTTPISCCTLLGMPEMVFLLLNFRLRCSTDCE